MNKEKILRFAKDDWRVGFTILLAIPLLCLAVWVSLPLPDLLTKDTTRGVTIEDRHGLALRSTRATDGSNAQWVPYTQIDPDLINAFVAVEDRRFWDHHGIDVRAVGRAMRDNLRSRRVVSGASTITMQLARLLQPAERSWGGKATQALWALRLERHLSKQQILEQYLNRVALGQGTAGVAAATAVYFNGTPSEVGVGQAATLAGLAHAPSRDNPHVSAKRARAQRLMALTRMRDAGFITREDAARARDEPIAGSRRSTPFVAPHFTTRVLAWTADARERARDTKIQTSLDLDLQRVVEAEVRHTVDVLRDRGVAHAAAVVLDNASGEVLAWVGSPNFMDPENGQTDMVVSERQPGSALKPFLFGLALDRGFTAATILPDIPKTYPTTTGPYRPRNYDRRFRGPVRAREALGSSYNVPAVELAERVGTASLLETLHLAGFSSLRQNADHYGLGLALGNGDVTLIELANAYRALANGGEWRDWTWRLSAVPRTGATRRVMSATSSAIVLDILSDPAARMPGFGLETPFDFPFPVAVKTGTSRHFTDNWAVGTTKAFTVAVWAGNFSGRPMEGVSGVTGAGPLLHRVVMATSARVAPGALTTPAEAGAVPVAVCRLSGLRSTNSCASMTEWFAPGTEPRETDTWERGGRVALPAEYAEWAPARVVAMVDSTPRPAKRPVVPQVFRILSPLDGDRYSIPPGVETRYASISLRANGPGDERVEWTVDGKEFVGDRWSLSTGTHVIEATSARGETVRVKIVVEK